MPIIGPRTVEQVDEYVKALDLVVDAETYDELDRASRIPLGQPHEANAERQRRPSVGKASGVGRFRLPERAPQDSQSRSVSSASNATRSPRYSDRTTSMGRSSVSSDRR